MVVCVCHLKHDYLLPIELDPKSLSREIGGRMNTKRERVWQM